MKNVFISGLWETDGKYAIGTYLKYIPRVVNMINATVEHEIQHHPQGTLPVKFVIYTSKDVRERIINYPEYIKHSPRWSGVVDVVFEIIEFEELPVRSKIEDPCGLKLGWSMPASKMNNLVRIWCNKIWLMERLVLSSDINDHNIIWLDAGLKKMHERFPRQLYKHFGRIEKNAMYTNIYGRLPIGGPRLINPILPVERGGLGKVEGRKLVPERIWMQPYNIRHLRCKYPHFKMANVMACHTTFISEFSESFYKTLEHVSSTCGCFDEETVLSVMYLDNPDIFKIWMSLLPKK